MNYYEVDTDDFIEKSRGAHKYLKRSGSPGNYRYWYRLPDGQVVQGNDVQQAAGKKNHLKRLVAGKEAGHHSLEDRQIAEQVGVETKRVRYERSNMRQSARTTGGAGHDFERHHLDEAMADPNHPSYERHIQAGVEHEASQAATSATAARPARARRSRSSGDSRSLEPDPPPEEPGHESPRARPSRGVTRGRGLEPEGETPATRPAASAHAAAAPAAPISQPPAVDASRQPGGSVFTSDSSEGASLRMAHRRAHGSASIDARGHAVPATPERAAADAHAARRAAAEESPAPAKTPSERIAKLRAKLAEKHGIRLGEPEPAAPAPAETADSIASGAQAEGERLGLDGDEIDEHVRSSVEGHQQREAERARALSARHHPESAPGTPAAAELSRSDPDFGASETEIQRAVQAQQNGHNPYLHRAVEIFHRIRGDLKPERKQTIDNFFQAHGAVQARGEIPTRENVFAAYKVIPGNERKRSLPAVEFESGTFHTMDEVFDNPTINPEIERMKRGYAAKQFQRLKPFLKEGWLTTNPSAPPPMPTFGDLKTWSEHGGPKPSWAGNTRIAVPEEVFNASHKSPDGKPKYPPPWMAIHLMPVWAYMAKSMEKKKGASIWEAGQNGKVPAYAADKTPTRNQSSSTGWDMNMGNQARSGQAFEEHGPEGMIVNAMRKYVQMRGGPDQLTDIPGSKLTEAGLTHRDIFKSNDLSDAALKRLSTSKVIDPVGLMAIVKRMIKAQTKKSFELVIDLDAAAYRPGETIRKAFVPQQVDLAKAMKIDRIKGILRARGRA